MALTSRERYVHRRRSSPSQSVHQEQQQHHQIRSPKNTSSSTNESQHHQDQLRTTLSRRRMLFTAAIFSTLFILGSFINGCDCYGRGAPRSVCQRLVPGHGVDQQYGPSPYRIQVNNMDSRDGSVHITISAPSDYLRGFILQARLYRDPSQIVNGMFIGDESETQTLDCGSHAVSFTHYTTLYISESEKFVPCVPNKSYCVN